MKKHIIILTFLFSVSSFFAQTEYSIASNPGTPSSNYTLVANTNFSIHINVFIDANSTLKGFKTTFDDTHELEWDLTKFEKNKWIELAHNFSTTSEMINPVLKIDMINDASTGFGAGTFYTDDIRIYDTSSLSTEDLSAKIEIFPNPVTNILTIKNIKQESEILFFNLLGASFKPKFYASVNKKSIVDLSGFSTGVYFLKIIDGDKVLTKKIIKK